MNSPQEIADLQHKLRWALYELDKYVSIGGDGVARNRCEGQVVDDYIVPYGEARKLLNDCGQSNKLHKKC